MIVSQRNASATSPICQGPITPTPEVIENHTIVHESSKIPAPPVVTGSRKWKSQPENGKPTQKQATHEFSDQNFENSQNLPNSNNSLQSASHQPPSHSQQQHFTINSEQRTYYMLQFRMVQLDWLSYVRGDQARTLFTKSDIPVRELSKIWELSDIDRDGQLNLIEFCYAFHLVVLRKKYRIALPNQLPDEMINSLQPLFNDLQKLNMERLNNAQNGESGGHQNSQNFRHQDVQHPQHLAKSASADIINSNVVNSAFQTFNSNNNANNSAYSKNLISLDEEYLQPTKPAPSSNVQYQPNYGNYYQESQNHQNPQNHGSQNFNSAPNGAPHQFASFSDWKSVANNANQNLHFDQDANWETFSEISTISSISLAKFPPNGSFNIQNGTNQVLPKPTAIRMTPSMISAAGGYNPWQQELKKLEEEKGKNEGKIKISKDAEQEDFDSKKAASSVKNGKICINVENGKNGNSNSAIHSKNQNADEKIQKPTQIDQDAEDKKTSSQDSVKMNLNVQNSVPDKKLSPGNFKRDSRRNSNRKRHNSSSSSVPMMLRDNDMLNGSELHEQKREHYRRIAEGIEGSSLSSDEEENMAGEKEKITRISKNSHEEVVVVVRQIQPKSNSLPKDSKLPEDSAQDLEEESESTKEHDTLGDSHDDSTNLVNNKQVQGWTQDGITRRNGGGGGGSVSNSSSDSSSMLSSQESEDEHDQNFLHTKSNEHRTKSVEETPLREDEDGEDDEDFEIETNFETNNPGGNPQVQIDPPPLAQSNTVIDVSKHASVPPEIPARSGSTSSIGSSIDKLSQRLKNTSMNNLATFDHSPKHTPKRGQKTDNNQSQSSSVEQLNNRNKSSDSEANRRTLHSNISDVLSDPGIALLKQHNLSRTLDPSKPAQISFAENETAKSDHQKMVASIRERNQRLQKMNTELENELRTLVEDRVLLDVHIDKMKKVKPGTAPTTVV